jgi:hypothetical protein
MILAQPACPGVCPRYAALRELHIPEDKDTAKTRTSKDSEDNITRHWIAIGFRFLGVFEGQSEDARGQRGRREDVVRVVEDVAFRSRNIALIKCAK